MTREQYLATVLPEAARTFLAAARAEVTEAHRRHDDPCECEYDNAMLAIIDTLITRGCEVERVRIHNDWINQQSIKAAEATPLLTGGTDNG